MSFAQSGRERLFWCRFDARARPCEATDDISLQRFRGDDAHYCQGTDEGYQFTKQEYESRSEEDEYQSLKRFIETVASDGIVTNFDIHARIAVIAKKNFPPKHNRSVPPLRYHQVYRLAEQFPELNISLNGGIETLPGVEHQLEECPSLSGVMIGRAWCANPWSFALADEVLYGKDDQSSRPKNRVELLQAFGRHADYEEATYNPVKIRRFITKSVSHIFSGEPNAKRYRIALDKIAGLAKKLSQERQPPLPR